MSRFRSIPRALAALAVAGAALATAGGPALADTGRGDDGPPSIRQVYEVTNAAAGNAVQVFDQAPDGTLTAGTLVPTGGLGAGNSLGSQGGIVRDGKTLLVVNAGDDTVSSLQITNRGGLELRDVEPSGGDRPVSVTVHDDLVYVVHAGSNDISGLRLGRDGRLEPLAGSTRPLSAPGAGPAQIQFTGDGHRLVVTEKATSRILTYPVAGDGRAGDPTVTASAGQTPFGFDLDRMDRVYVSEAASGSSSSYRIGGSGGVTAISPAVPLNQGAPCWLVVSHDGRFAYTTNAASGSISSYRIGPDGSLTLLASVAATPGAGPTDLALSGDGRFLHARVRSGDVASYTVTGDGSLTPIGVATGAPSIGSSGLAAG
ncbi:MAG: lactonase family protein [Acidimicrobiia bacterium]|nr:lactonase family protein [Acidimicrobiia bacterium]MDH4364009.1 lactonase family protein [Acidimicrobiia bacterium]MDH5289003.1 lactonase family protein [Acidimicrobiia bacterium]